MLQGAFPGIDETFKIDTSINVIASLPLIVYFVPDTYRQFIDIVLFLRQKKKTTSIKSLQVHCSIDLFFCYSSIPILPFFGKQSLYFLFGSWYILYLSHIARLNNYNKRIRNVTREIINIKGNQFILY